MKKVILFAALSSIALFSSAQLVVNSRGQLVAGKESGVYPVNPVLPTSTIGTSIGTTTQLGSLTKAKRYVVRNVVLGNPADNSQTNYSVGNGGELSVHAIDKVSIYNGFSILDGGSAEFECDQSVELNGGIVRKGGRLVIRAKDVRMASGFKVEEGGILKIENN